MNCETCGLLYRENIPHPPSACANYAGAELRKAKQALDGALNQISVMAKEREELLTPRELNMAIDSVSRNYARLRDLRSGIRIFTPAESDVLTREMEELRLFHLKLVKWNRRDKGIPLNSQR